MSIESIICGLRGAEFFYDGLPLGKLTDDPVKLVLKPYSSPIDTAESETEKYGTTHPVDHLFLGLDCTCRIALYSVDEERYAHLIARPRPWWLPKECPVTCGDQLLSENLAYPVEWRKDNTKNGVPGCWKAPAAFLREPPERTRRSVFLTFRAAMIGELWFTTDPEETPDEPLLVQAP